MHFHALTGLVPVLLTLSGAPVGGHVVSEAELLSRLGSDDPAVVRSSSELPLARAGLLDARLHEDPVLELGREDPSGAVSQTEWLLTWQLPGLARRLEINAAEKSVDAAAARVENRLRVLRAGVREAYADWAVASTRRELLAASLDRLDALAARESARAENGESSGLEARRLGLAAAALEARLSLASAEVRRARVAVDRVWPDLAPDARPRLPDLAEAAALGDVPDAPSRTASPTAEHPLLSATRADAEAAELARRASERFLEAPALTVGWQRQESLDAEVSGPVIGLSWTLPLFDRRQAARQAAQARLERARAEAVLASREIAARREAALSRYEDLANEAAAAEAVLEPSADMLVAAETSFRYGELPLTDLLDIQRSVIDAQLAWLDLHAAALEALRELDTLAPSDPTSEAFQSSP